MPGSQVTQFRKLGRSSDKRLSDYANMFLRAVVFAAVANFLAVAAWSEERPKVIFNPPQPPPGTGAIRCEATCEQPCAKWAGWQTDPQFSYETCVAKCEEGPPSCGMYGIVPRPGRRQPP